MHVLTRPLNAARIRELAEHIAEAGIVPQYRNDSGTGHAWRQAEWYLQHVVGVLLESQFRIEVVDARHEVHGVREVSGKAHFLGEDVVLLVAQGVQLGERRCPAVDGGAVEVLVNLVVAGMVAGDRVDDVAVAELPFGPEPHLVHVVPDRLLLVRQVLEGIVAVEAWILGRNLAPVAKAVVGEDGIEAVRRRPAQRRRVGGEIDVAGRIVQRDVVVEAVAFAGNGAHLERQGVVDQRDVDPALDDSGVEVADLSGQPRSDLVELRPHPVDHHVAADGVLAEQNALGTPVNLDALHIEGVDQLAGAGAHLNAIDDDADLRALGFFDVRVTDAADVQGAGAGTGGVHADVHVRDEAVEVPQGLRLDLLDLLRAKGGHRKRHVLLGFLAAPGSDHDLLDQAGRILLRSHPGGRLNGQGEAEGQQRQGTRRAKPPNSKTHN